MSPTSARSTRGIGSAQATPWVTFLMAALCICLQGVGRFAERQINEEVGEELAQAVDYLYEHPYLEPGPVLATRIDRAQLASKRALDREARDRRGVPPRTSGLRQRHQHELDALVAQASAGLSRLPSQRFGFRASRFEPLTLLTYGFIHAGFAHLAGALCLFLLLGFHLEKAWGSGVFLVVVLLSGAASAAVFAAGCSGSGTPLVGLSPVVAALTTAFAIRFRSLWKQPIYGGLILAAAVFLLAPVRWGSEWSIAADLPGNTALAAQKGASYWAFAGGAVFGLLAGLTGLVFSASGEAGGSSARGQAKRARSPALEKAIRAQLAGRLAEAYGTLAEHLRREPDDHEALLHMWNVALENGRPADAANAMLRAIRDELRRNDTDAAVEHWFDLTHRGLNADAEPALLIRLALLLQQQQQGFAAVAALQQALDKAGGPNAAVVASRVARASRDLDAETARAAAWRALGSVDLDLEERQGLEEMLAEIGSGIDTLPSARSVDPGPARGPLPAEPDPPRAVPPAAREPEPWVDPALVDDGDPEPTDRGAGSEAFVLADVIQPPAAYARSSPIDLDLAVRELRTVEAIPLSLEGDGLLIEAAGGTKKRVPFERLEAVSVAAVGGLSDKPIILVDLLMNWASGGGDPLKAIRLRADRFDARRVVREVTDPLEALRVLVRELLHHSGAQPLPDAASAAGMPFASFDDLTVYERAVLGTE